jgi:hypothetical protein
LSFFNYLNHGSHLHYSETDAKSLATRTLIQAGLSFVLCAHWQTHDVNNKDEKGKVLISYYIKIDSGRIRKYLTAIQLFHDQLK